MCVVVVVYVVVVAWGVLPSRLPAVAVRALAVPAACAVAVRAF